MERAEVFSEAAFFPLDRARRKRNELFRFRARLESLGYSEASLTGALGMDGPYSTDPAWRQIWHRYFLDHENPLHVLIRLFFLAFPVEEGALKALLEPDEISLLQELRLLVRVDPTSLQAPVSLYPVGSTYVATDWWRESDEGARAAPDRVMHLGMDSYGLSRLVASASGRRGLDVGTGSGVGALKAAPRAEQVIGVDINPRAINFARFNALLNGIENCEFLEGDVLEPVSGRRFDLLMANPPFVPTPGEGRLLYRDGGLSGEDVLRRIIEGCAEHLTDGGVCLVRSDQVRQEHVAYEEKLRRWLGTERGFACVVLRGPPINPYEYAVNQLHGARSAEVRDQLFAWIDHYRAQRIEEVSHGYLAIRGRPSRETVMTELPIPDVLEHDLPPGVLEGLFSRIEVLERVGLHGLGFHPTYNPGQVDVLGRGLPVRGVRLPYEVATQLESLRRSETPISMEGLVAGLREHGFEVGPERESELMALLEWLIIAGHLEPSEMASTEGLHKSEAGRMAASRLWWSR